VTSDDDTPQGIGLPSRVSLSGLVDLWNRWRPWGETCARHPSLSLKPFLQPNRLARTSSNTLSSAAPLGNSSCGRRTGRSPAHYSVVTCGTLASPVMLQICTLTLCVPCC